MRGLSIEVKYFDTVEDGQGTESPTWVAGVDLDISDVDVSELSPEYFYPRWLALDDYVYRMHGIRLFGIVNYGNNAGNGEKPDEA